MNNVCLYLKYIKPKYLEHLENGYIHFSPLNVFKKIEENGDKTIGDKFEGHMVHRYPKNDHSHFYIEMRNRSDNKIVKKVDITKYFVNNKYGYAMESKIIFNEMKNWGIFCATCLDTNDEDVFTKKADFSYQIMDDMILIHESRIMKPEFINNLYNEVGGDDKVPVILKSNFFEKLNKYVKESDKNMSYGSVNYYSKTDMSNVSNNDNLDLQAMNSVFTKDEKYKGQKEFRIALYEDCTKLSSDINIGSLKDCILEVPENIPDLGAFIDKTISTKATQHIVFLNFLSIHCLNKYIIKKAYHSNE